MQSSDSNGGARRTSDHVFASLFGDDDVRNATKPTAPLLSTPPKRTGKPRGIRLRASHIKFVTELLKSPDNQGAAYLRAYPKASPQWASKRASRLLHRPDVSAEIQRRQNISATTAAISRAAVEQRLYDILSFDFRRLYYPATLEDGSPHPKAGQPKEPHELDDDAAQVMESYEKTFGRYGDAVKFRTTDRLAAAELLAKLRGWAKDDGRPPITANFQFNFGPRPASPQEVKGLDVVPPRLYGTLGLRVESARAQPLPQAFDEHGNPLESILPPGYETERGVRIKSRSREVANDPLRPGRVRR